MSDILSKTIQNMLVEGSNTNYLCPFCGAEKEFINITKLNKDSTEFKEQGQYQYKREFGLVKIKPLEYHCSKCMRSWAIDKDGNEYNIVKNTENSNKDINMYSEPDLGNKLKFSDFYQNVKNTNVLLAPNGQKSTEQRPFYADANPIMFKEELSEKQKIKLQKKHKIIYKDGEFFAAQETIKPKYKNPIKESMLLDCVKILDDKFKLNERLIRLVEKNDKRSLIEQKISNFIHENDEYTFEEFLEYLNENDFEEESKYIEIIKESITKTNEEIDNSEQKVKNLMNTKTNLQKRIREIDIKITNERNKKHIKSQNK